ncbi:MAG: hypothetical protein IPP46_01075 [Bacteroidetes bacterium]|nr:hypothetical protein [Bacteroidota bacterium]
MISGLKGYEITGKAFNKKKVELVVYEVMLFVDDANYYDGRPGYSALRRKPDAVQEYGEEF